VESYLYTFHKSNIRAQNEETAAQIPREFAKHLLPQGSRVFMK